MDNPNLTNKLKNPYLDINHIHFDDDVDEVPFKTQNADIDYDSLILDALKQLSSIFHFTSVNQRIPLIDVNKNMLPTIELATSNVNLSKLLISLQSKDDYTLRHSVAVSIISTLIGKWLKLESKELKSLSLAAILHDIGKVQVSSEILNKPGKFSNDEFALMKKHTIYGYKLIKNTVGTSHRQALAALEHHERMDGSGYPFGLTGEKLSLFGKIVAVADVFHAMSSTRVYHQSLPIYQVLSEMRDGLFGKFDSQIVTVFINKMMESLIGDQVQLSNGSTATIVMINSIDPMRPLVQTGSQFIDLSQDYSINIIEF